MIYDFIPRAVLRHPITLSFVVFVAVSQFRNCIKASCTFHYSKTEVSCPVYDVTTTIKEVSYYGYMFTQVGLLVTSSMVRTYTVNAERRNVQCLTESPAYDLNPISEAISHLSSNRGLIDLTATCHTYPYTLEMISPEGALVSGVGMDKWRTEQVLGSRS
ncbi:hypothetical protein BDQ17DRAFT_911143 [Cyathus striatus]|nr:hypothetical protein BDQ17DRAFT_911143 [Cyathus striatus]